jgi:CHAT domain-containing protein
LCATAVVAQETVTVPRSLAVGEPASATQRAGESVSYAFDASAGATYLIEVAQRGLDFTVTVEGGGTTRGYNSPLKRDEGELVIVEASHDERFRVTLTSDENTDASGEHEIRVQLVDARSPPDPRWKGAWLSMSDAAAANAAGDRANAEQARNLYLAAAAFWEQLGQTHLQAQALYSVGKIEYLQLENWNAAFDNANKAAELYRGLDEKLYANSLFLRAYAQIETASEFQAATKEALFQRALTTFDEALRLHDALGNDFDRAHVLNFIGITHWYRADRAHDDFDVARSYYNQSAELFARLGEWREELNCLQNIVVIDNAEGKNLQAIASYERILARLPPGRDPTLRAIILANLGAAHLGFGNVDEALQLQSEALALYQSVQNRTGQGEVLRNLGATYFAFGDFGRAKQYLEQAQTLSESANDYRTQATIQNSLGDLAFAESDYATARERHQRAVELTTSSEERARRTLLLGKDLAALGRHEDAIEAASTAHEARSDVTRADALLQMGLSYIALGDTSRAVAALDEARNTYETLQLTARLGDALHAYSLAARADGDFEVARAYGRMALEKIESLRERVAHPELRALNSATRRRYYEDQIDLLMQLHESSGAQAPEYLYEALSVDERSRARLSLDLLGEAAMDVDRSMGAEVAARRRALYASLAETRQRQERPNSREIADELAAKMRDIENDLALLETEYRRAQPGDDLIGSEQILDAKGIRAAVDTDTVLLQYSLGETRSYVWAVTTDSIRGFSLPARAAIEEAARAVRSDIGKAPGSRPSSKLSANLALLSGYLLNDVADLIAAKPRVLVAADGALQYIPFGVLLTPSSADATQRSRLVSLAENREIISVASLSAKSASQRRPSAPSAAPAIAVFADPVMEQTDSRLYASRSAALPPPFDASLSTTRSSTGPSLSRLPYTGEEARAIANLLPHAANLIAVGFDANLDAVLGHDLRQYRYIHFATHGIVDSERPPLSALALSQFDEHGRSRAGYLRLYDIYTLELDADVVVLSACDTALGREIRGESLIGLTQGFLYAGAKNVVASLWQVPDNATSELMTRFYQLLLSGDRSPAQALAAAQRSMAAERLTSDPYFWGAFVIQER